MRSFDKIFIGIVVMIAVIFIGANVLLLRQEDSDIGRPYRVEIGRIEQIIENDGLMAVDMSAYEYVTDVVKDDGSEAFYETDSDYALREIDGVRYRFDYSADARQDRTGMVIMVNVILGVMAVAIVVVMLYVRQKILRPFGRLSDVPYELAKGNLTVPVKESKSRFFGRFVWGVDLLREHMEEQKERELALQKDRKTLVLSLSHDIKTPLSAIKLYSKALSKGLYTDKDRQLEIAENINAKADEIEGYVSQIVNASREDFLALEVQAGEFYLSELMSNVESYYREKLALIKTEFQVGAYVDCLLHGDRERGIEVIQNLMENAIKYGDGSRITLSVSEEDGCALVSVKNSGCTLPETELPHVFDSFWRGSNAGGAKGSGLGLYICRQLMHKMNGDIFAEARDGEMSVTAVFAKV